MNIQPDSGTTQQVTLGNSAQQICNKRKGRCGIKITNLSAIDVYIGFNNNVTNQSGDLLIGVKGAWNFYETDSALWAYGPGATLSELELL